MLTTKSRQKIPVKLKRINLDVEDSLRGSSSNAFFRFPIKLGKKKKKKLEDHIFCKPQEKIQNYIE